MSDKIGIIGYSGHAYVIIEAAKLLQHSIIGYYEKEKLPFNPYRLTYLGNEEEVDFKGSQNKYIIGIGNNRIRQKIAERLQNHISFASIVHPNTLISETSKIGLGTFINANVTINALATIGEHCILNTGCIIEHECCIDNYVHIGPGAVLAGNVQVCAGTFIGANVTVKQGIKIGHNVIIGAGTVVIRDIPDNVTIVGNPSKIIKNNG